MNIDAPLTEAATFTQPDMYSSAIKTFSALALILAVILICFYLVKRFWPRGSGLLNADRLISVITTSPIAHKKMISVVEVGGEILVLGLTDSHITMLTKVTDEQVVHRFKAGRGKRNMNSPFYKQIQGLITRSGSEGDGEEALYKASRDNDQPLGEGTLPGVNS
jgi:flagellar biosynthetic protein FliO